MGCVGNLHMRRVRVPEHTNNGFATKFPLSGTQIQEHDFRTVHATAADEMQNLHELLLDLLLPDLFTSTSMPSPEVQRASLVQSI